MQALGQQRRAEHRALFDALHSGAQASELRQNPPEKYRDFVARATADGPLENLYIPAERFQTYFQAVGIDPTQAARELAIEEANQVRAGLFLAVPPAPTLGGSAGRMRRGMMPPTGKIYPNLQA